MSYFISYMADGATEPVDGDDVASNTGWAAFADWAAGLPDEDYPQLGYLGEHGECFPAEAIAALEQDLARAISERPGSPTPDVLATAHHLLTILRARPSDDAALVITDGTEGEVSDPDEPAD